MISAKKMILTWITSKEKKSFFIFCVHRLDEPSVSTALKNNEECAQIFKLRVSIIRNLMSNMQIIECNARLKTVNS